MRQILSNISIALLFLVAFSGCAAQDGFYTDNPEAVYSRAMRFYEAEKWGRASRSFENVSRMYINTPREDSIVFFISRCKFKDKNYHTAITYLESYRYQFSRSRRLEEVDGMLALCYYYISPGPERDPTNTLQALSSIEEFLSRYPKSDNVGQFLEIRTELISRLHERSYLNAYTYYKVGQYKSAIAAFRNALKEYPESIYREKTMYYMNLAGYELARNSIPSLEVDRYMALVDMYYSFVAEFPESEYRKDLDRILEVAKKFLDKSSPELNKEQNI